MPEAWHTGAISSKRGPGALAVDRARARPFVMVAGLWKRGRGRAICALLSLLRASRLQTPVAAEPGTGCAVQRGQPAVRRRVRVGLMALCLLAVGVLTCCRGTYRGSAEAHIVQGDLDLEQGNVDLAIEEYGRAIELQPGNASAYFRRGNAFVGLGEVEHAIADYDRAVELQPDHAEAFNNRGRAYFVKAEHEQEGGNLEQAWADYEQGLADFDMAVQLQPDSVLALLNRGMAFFLVKGDAARAIADFDRVIQLQPDSARAHYSRGVAHRLDGERERARRDWLKVLELTDDPDLRTLTEGQLRALGNP